MSATDDVLVSNILTSDGVPATVRIYAIPLGSVVGFQATVSAIDVSGNAAGWAFLGMVKNTNGTPTVVGTPQAIYHPADSGAAGWTVTLGTDANGINATLTGSGGVNINWTLRSVVNVSP